MLPHNGNGARQPQGATGTAHRRHFDDFKKLKVAPAIAAGVPTKL